MCVCVQSLSLPDCLPATVKMVEQVEGGWSRGEPSEA